MWMYATVCEQPWHPRILTALYIACKVSCVVVGHQLNAAAVCSAIVYFLVLLKVYLKQYYKQ